MNFSNAFRGPGHPGRISGMSQQKGLLSLGFEGANERFYPHPFACKTLLDDLQTQKTSHSALFSCLCKYFIYCIFPVLKLLLGVDNSGSLRWTYKMPGGQKFRFKLSPLSVGFSERRPLNLIKKTPVCKLPGCDF